MYGGVEAWVQAFLTLTLGGDVSGQIQVPSTSPTEKKTFGTYWIGCWVDH
jgi:hypothetical protein